MRTIEQIDDEIAATRARLDELLAERADFFAEKARTRTARHAAIVKAFDDGASREQIVMAFGVTYSMVNSLLHRRGRNERQRREAKLGPAERAHYDKLIRQSMSSRLAAQIAESLS